MKELVKKRFAFAGKSLLWSFLLYVVLMLAFNWDEVSNTVRGKNPITVGNVTVSSDQAGAHVATHSRFSQTLVVIFKALSGISQGLSGN